jgi:uncharacterized repeat protein (TIGR01451 family)
MTNFQKFLAVPLGLVLIIGLVNPVFAYEQISGFSASNQIEILTDDGMIGVAKPLYTTALDPSQYVVAPGGTFDGVADLILTSSLGGTFRCTGSLLESDPLLGFNDTIILTAAHCLDTNLDGVNDVTSGTAKFEAAMGNQIIGINPGGTVMFPGWDGLFARGDDIAIIELVSAPSSDVNRYVYDTNPDDDIGGDADQVGYGRTGNMTEGDVDASGIKHAIINDRDATADAVSILFGQPTPVPGYGFVTDSDNGLTANDACAVIGVCPAGLGNGNDEGISASGDSGGPSFASGEPSVVMGVTSWGGTLFGLGQADIDNELNSSYGEFAIYTRVSQYSDWITQTLTAKGKIESPGADLSILKTDNGTNAIAGQNYNYTIKVTNPGPFDALDVFVNDTLPTDTTFVSSNVTTANGGADVGATFVEWVLNTLTANSMQWIEIEVFVDESVADATILNNTAAVNSTTNDNDLTNNEDFEETTTGNPNADLSILKTDDNTNATAGQNYNYTIKVTNPGPFDALNVFVNDTLPIDTTFVSSNVTTANGGADVGATFVEWILNTLTANSMQWIEIEVFVDESVADATILNNTAAVNSTTNDNDLTNNEDFEETSVDADADLSITKSSNPNPVDAGNSLTYTVMVNNTGPSNAKNVIVTDTLPAEVSFLSTTGCNDDPNGVPTCSLGDIVAGDSSQYTISVTVDVEAEGIISNQATVSSDTPDSQSNNNLINVPVTVIPKCVAPISGDWLITLSCYIDSDIIAPGNISIQNSSLVRIDPGNTLTINSGNNITIQSESGLLVKDGATLQINA